MAENKYFDVLWYTNITMSQVKELIDLGKYDMAKNYLDNAKNAIKEICPEAMQADELETK